MTVGVGIVGCGLIGRKRAGDLPAAMRLVGCFDVDAEPAGRVRPPTAGDGSRPHPRWRTSSRARRRSTWSSWPPCTTSLARVALAALRAGKHVLIEKPGAIDRQRLAPRSVTSPPDSACEVRVGYNHRFHPSFAKLRELRRRRDDGPLLFVRARYGHGGRLGYEQEWRADRDRLRWRRARRPGLATSSTSSAPSSATSTSPSPSCPPLFWHDGRRGQRVPRPRARGQGASPGCTRRGPSGRTSSRSRSCSSGPRSRSTASAAATARSASRSTRCAADGPAAGHDVGVAAGRRLLARRARRRPRRDPRSTGARSRRLDRRRHRRRSRSSRRHIAR